MVVSVATSAPRAGLSLDYCSRAELTRQPSAWWQSVLGVVPFGTAAHFESQHDIPVAPVGLPLLGASDAACEVWQLDEPLTSGRTGRVHFRKGHAALFGCIVMPETDDDAGGG